MGKLLCRYCQKELGETSKKEDVFELCDMRACLDKWATDNPPAKEAKSIDEVVVEFTDAMKKMDEKVAAIADKVDSLSVAPVKDSENP
jgi:hypothetical protein